MASGPTVTRVVALIRQCELLMAFLETDEHIALSPPTMLIVPNHALVAVVAQGPNLAV